MKSLATLLVILAWTASPAPAQHEVGARLVDSFEQDEEGAIPSRWWRLNGRSVVPLDTTAGEPGEFYAVLEEDGHRFLRLRVEDESVRLVVPNGSGMNWDLRAHPNLGWRWRVNEIPPGAREDRLNDVAAAVYVTFSFDWLGRPRSIKYTYSSTLPVGTILSQGRLKVIVVGSGKRSLGAWARVIRNVAEDYEQVFGQSPPDRPVSIAVWSDSDTTKSTAEVDFDDLVLLPPWR